MNCKQGDLARIISHKQTESLGIVDMIVRVAQLVTTPKGQPAWIFETMLRANGYIVMGLADELLRPIGNPGEDAQDETLSWLPVPLKEYEDELQAR